MSVPIHRAMRGRDPLESHRVASPLELFFDLTVVVAVAGAAAQLHHAITAGHLLHGLVGFSTVFFAIWWAWVNFTWFSSAFDTDDLQMRLMTMLQMIGVLVLAAGVPSAFESGDFTVAVIGYVVMRVALVLQWVRAQHESGDPYGICRRYWTAILFVQVYWVARLWAPEPWGAATLVLGFLAELAVPIYAERGTPGTSWHPSHIAERYGAFVIIVCGEVILSASNTFSAAVEHGLTVDLLLVAVGAVLIVFTLFSFYFHRDASEHIVTRGPWSWAYLHGVIFASVAVVGAGIGVMVDLAQAEAHLPLIGGDLVLAGAVASYLVALGLSSWVVNRYHHEMAITVAIAVVVLAVGILGRSPGVTTMAIGLVLLGCLVVNALLVARIYGDPAPAAVADDGEG